MARFYAIIESNTVRCVVTILTMYLSLKLNLIRQDEKYLKSERSKLPADLLAFLTIG